MTETPATETPATEIPAAETAVPKSTAERGAVGAALRGTRSAIASVMTHPGLRRIQLALGGSMIGDWAYATATTVWAYGVGGAKAVGLWVSIRLLLMACLSPLAATLADRWPRKLVMIGSDLSRCVLVIAAGVCIATGTQPAPVFVLATLASVLACAFRPAVRAWMPSLAEDAEQLTAANGVSSTIESLAIFVGPAIGAALVAATNIQTVFYINAATFLLSALLTMGIRARAAAPVSPSGAEPADAVAEGAQSEGALAAMLAGFREIGRSRDLRLVAFLVSAQTLVAGASSVFAVILAVKYLHVGPRGVGYFDAVTGVGAVVGGFVAIALSVRQRLTTDLGIGVALWSLPLLLIVAWPSAATMFAAAAVLGLANPIVDVNFYTAVQSLAPDRILGRVFGALEAMLIGSAALGAVVMPYLVQAVGMSTSLAILAVGVGAPAVLLLPLARRADGRLNRPQYLSNLQRLPIFAPLGAARLEALARHVVQTTAPAGSVIVAEGDVGSQFYLIKSGRVVVTHADRVLREQETGDYFGEIALIRDVPRTATVTAVGDTVLLTLEREPFLEAVTDSGEASAALDDVVSYRMRF